MKKLLSVMLSALMLTAALAGCGSSSAPPAPVLTLAPAPAPLPAEGRYIRWPSSSP